MIKKLTKSISIIILILIIQSCGMFNKVSKDSTKNKQSSEIKIEKEESKEIVDLSTTIIKEKGKGITYTKPSTSENNLIIRNLEDINNLEVLSNDLVSIRQTFNPLTNTLKTTANLKPQEASYDIDKTTTINNDIKSSSKSKTDSLDKKDNILKTNNKIKEPINMFWYVIGLIVILGVSYFIIKFIIKKIKSKVI